MEREENAGNETERVTRMVRIKHPVRSPATQRKESTPDYFILLYWFGDNSLGLV